MQFDTQTEHLLMLPDKFRDLCVFNLISYMLICSLDVCMLGGNPCQKSYQQFKRHLKAQRRNSLSLKNHIFKIQSPYYIDLHTNTPTHH